MATIYLRDQNNKTIVDIEVFCDDNDDGYYRWVELHSIVDIRGYSALLLNLPAECDKGEFISTFYDLQELRGWMWEHYFTNKSNDSWEPYNDIVNEVRKIVDMVAAQYNLIRVED